MITEPESQSREIVLDRQMDGCYRAKEDEELRQRAQYRSATRIEQHSLQIVLDDREGQRNYLPSVIGFDGLEWNWIWWPARWAKWQDTNGEAYNQAIISNTATYAQKVELGRRLWSSSPMLRPRKERRRKESPVSHGGWH